MKNSFFKGCFDRIFHFGTKVNSSDKIYIKLISYDIKLGLGGYIEAYFLKRGKSFDFPPLLIGLGGRDKNFAQLSLFCAILRAF